MYNMGVLYQLFSVSSMREVQNMKKGAFASLAAILACVCFLLGFQLGRARSASPVTLSTLPAATLPAASEAPPVTPEKPDINTASAKQLSAVPVIGSALAERIVAYREQYGAFHSLAELCNVEGIDADLLAYIRPYISIGVQGE